MELYNTYNPADKKAAGLFIGRVFMYMFIGILITTVIAVGMGLGFTQWIFGTLDIGDAYVLDEISAFDVNKEAATTLLTLLIISGISLIILAFVISIFFLKGNHNLLIPSVLYASLMGVTMSSFVIFVPWSILGTAFGITTLIFAVMTAIAFLSKGSLNFLGILGIGLFVGAGLLSLIGFFLYLGGASEAFMTLYWIVSFMSFAAILFITIWDLWRLKQIALRGEHSTNLALYCAFTLYVDFIYILIRMIYFLLQIYGRNK